MNEKMLDFCFIVNQCFVNFLVSMIFLLHFVSRGEGELQPMCWVSSAIRRRTFASNFAS